MSPDWVEWHRRYDDPASYLSQRLELVQGHLRAALDGAPAGAIRLISMCAGQGRDVVGVLARHPRTPDVRALLVERDPRIVETARQSIARSGLDHVEVVCGDAGVIGSYAGAVPAQVVLVCGVFGNITDADVAHTVATLPVLCEPGATVIWTRHRHSPDLTPVIRAWFEEAGFEEIAFDGPSELSVGVGAHRFVGDPPSVEAAQRLRLFEFTEGACPCPFSSIAAVAEVDRPVVEGALVQQLEPLEKIEGQ